MFFNENKNAMENAGGTVITKSIYEGQSSLKWIYRESPSNENDNGWRAIGDTDTQEYMDDPQNSIVVDFNTLVEIEPAVLKIYELPVGTDLELVYDGKERYFVDTNTGERLD